MDGKAKELYLLGLIGLILLVVAIPVLGAESSAGQSGDLISLDASEYVKSSQDQIVAEGDVEIEYKAYNITGPRVVISRQDEVALLDSGVNLKSEDLELEAQWGQFFLAEEEFKARGDVELTYINEDGALLQMEADQVEIKSSPRVVLGEGNIYIIYKDYQLWGDEVEYREEEDKLVLKGNARAEQESGNLIQAREISFSLADEAIEARDGVEIEFILEEEDSQAPGGQQGE